MIAACAVVSTGCGRSDSTEKPWVVWPQTEFRDPVEAMPVGAKWSVRLFGADPVVMMPPETRRWSLASTTCTARACLAVFTDEAAWRFATPWVVSIARDTNKVIDSRIWPGELRLVGPVDDDSVVGVVKSEASSEIVLIDLVSMSSKWTHEVRFRPDMGIVTGDGHLALVLDSQAHRVVVVETATGDEQAFGWDDLHLDLNEVLLLARGWAGPSILVASAYQTGGHDQNLVVQELNVSSRSTGRVFRGHGNVALKAMVAAANGTLEIYGGQSEGASTGHICCQ